MSGCVTSRRPPGFAGVMAMTSSGTSSSAAVLAELREPVREKAVRRLRKRAGQVRMTLLTAAKDLEHSLAAVLAHWLNRVERSAD
jgi:uncharacterized protein YeaO (DUF488 family)